ncbi:MAG: SDR family oxidoreductase [Gracilibacteraceae bacterium]|nr:SDR family oxidoreductase [Gracilibacteraceae bacterium]
MGMLEGRAALVIGASSGAGRGCALRFAEEGANVLACARRMEKLEELVAEAKQKGAPGQIVAAVCDVSNEEDLDKVVKQTVAEFGKIEILANIAQGGIEHPVNLQGATREKLFESYATGPLYSILAIQKVLPYMKEQHYGRIVNCASGSAVSGTEGFAPYAMAKGAVMTLTRFAAKELGKYGITTNCFLPVSKAAGFDSSPQSRAAAAYVAERIPLGYFGDPYEDVSPIVAFMVSDYAHYMNGQFISCCGGLSIIA